VAGPRTWFVALILSACAAGAVCALLRAQETAPVDVGVEEMVRVRGGQAILVLSEKATGRRLPVPLSGSEAAQVDAALGGTTALGPEALAALGGRILGAYIDDVSAERGLRGHLSIGAGGGEVRVDASAGEALVLALQAGAPIRVDETILAAAAIARDELRGKSARNLHRTTTRLPVLGI
jgi:bifunctional DNase/RNase